MQHSNTLEPISKLTKWANEPTLESLLWDFQQAKPSRDKQVNKVTNWLNNLNVEGSAKIENKNKNRSSIVPKLIRKSAEWRYPALSEPFLSTQNLYQVDPATWADKAAAVQNALVLNHQFQTKINKVAFIDDYVRTVVDEGTAIVRVGWDFEEREITTHEPQYVYQPDPMFAEELQQVMPKYQESQEVFKNTQPEALVLSVEASMYYQQPVRAVFQGMKPVRKMQTIRNQPTVEVCDIRNLYIDPTCKGDLDKAQFIIYSFETTYAELKRDQRYKNLDRINVEHASGSDPYHSYSDDSQGMRFADKARKKLVVYEYWGYWDCDDNGTVRPIVATWVENTLIRLDENPFPDGKPPFVSTTYLPKRKEVYGEPDGVLLEEHQKIQGAVLRGIIDTMGRSANGQTGMQKGMLDATNRIKFERGEDYEFNPNVDPRSGVHMHQYPEIPQSAQFIIQMMNMEAESLTGVKAFSGSGGITGAALGDNVAGIRTAMDAASKREMSILRRLSAGIIGIGRKIISMNSQFLDETEIVRITDEKFVAIKRDDLAGEFDLKLTISTAEGDEAKAQQIGFMLQTNGVDMDPQLRNRMYAEIFRLRKMPEFAKEIENFVPQPDPMQQQIQMLEMQKLQAEIALLQAQAQEAMTKGALNQNKIPVEQARANSLQGEADQKSLNFVEQQEGVQHLRQLELQQAKDGAQLEAARQKHALDLEMKSLDFEANKEQFKQQHNSNLLLEHAKARLAPKPQLQAKSAT